MQLISIMIRLLISVSALNLTMADPDISKFYTQGAIIWTLLTTRDTNLQCRVDYVNTTTKNYTEFRRADIVIDSSSYEDLRGKFINMDSTKKDPPYNAMAVSLQKGNYYELRLKNTSIHTMMPPCITEFTRVTRLSTSLSLTYKQTCQTTRYD
uniref:Putative group i salivary lipocalin n=1 Tax=Rhipicephalus pulchellus TaxID=72859 RepID=L7LT53_RHIPC